MPQNFAKSSPYFWLTLHRTKVRLRFRKILWPSQNIWTLNNYICILVGVRRFGRYSSFLSKFEHYMSRFHVSRSNPSFAHFLTALSAIKYDVRAHPHVRSWHIKLQCLDTKMAFPIQSPYIPYCTNFLCNLKSQAIFENEAITRN